MADQTQDIYLQQGKTQPLVLRCETAPIIYKAITGISLAFGAPRLDVAGHGLTNGWRAACTRVGGMKQINAGANPPADRDYHACTVIDAGTIEFNDVIPVDDNDREWAAYTSGGFLQYNTPMDLTGYEARLQIRDKKNGAKLLFEMTTGADALISIDNTTKTVTLYFDAIDFTAMDWKKGYYELELYKDVVRGGQTIESVYSPLEGNVFLDSETAK